MRLSWLLYSELLNDIYHISEDVCNKQAILELDLSTSNPIFPRGKQREKERERMLNNIHAKRKLKEGFFKQSLKASTTINPHSPFPAIVNTSTGGSGEIRGWWYGDTKTPFFGAAALERWLCQEIQEVSSTPRVHPQSPFSPRDRSICFATSMALSRFWTTTAHCCCGFRR